MITEFEVWNCRFRSEQPGYNRTNFFFEYDVVFVDDGTRYRIQMDIREVIIDEVVHDFRFSDGSIVRVGSLRTMDCWKSAAGRLVEAAVTHDRWGYHVICLAKGTSIESVGNSWSREANGPWRYNGVTLHLNLPPIEWVETSARSCKGHDLGRPTRYAVADYRRECPLDE